MIASIPIGNHIYAEEYASVVASDEVNVTTHEWQLGVAMGIGVKTNPLFDGDNIPLLLIPDIAWYGEAFYFDNGELGYQLQLSKRMAIEGFVTPDTERAFFSFRHPANVFALPNMSTSGLHELPNINDDEGTQFDVSKDDVASRDWTMNAGLRIHYFLKQKEWQIAYQHDALSVHNGGKFSLHYRQHWQISEWKLSANVDIIWKSSKLLDYYYGIDERDGLDFRYHYNVDSGWQPRVGITASRPLSENWAILGMFSYQRLHASLSDSPLIKDNNIRSAFLGVAYRF